MPGGAQPRFERHCAQRLMADAKGRIGAGGGHACTVALQPAHPMQDGGRKRSDAHCQRGDAAHRARLQRRHLEPLFDHRHTGLDTVEKADIQRIGHAQVDLQRDCRPSRRRTGPVQRRGLACRVRYAIPAERKLAACPFERWLARSPTVVACPVLQRRQEETGACPPLHRFADDVVANAPARTISVSGHIGQTTRCKSLFHTFLHFPLDSRYTMSC